ncbi:type II toxin-antitoxin system prevent-host-death family antitoxin [Bartonella sp. B17]
MPVIITSRDFNHEVSKAKRVACKDTVFITDRGKPTHVLMSMEAYKEITEQGVGDILKRLAMPACSDIDLADIDLETERMPLLNEEREVF